VLTDIGVNLLHTQLADDLDGVLERARSAGVDRLMITATNLDEAHRAIALCDSHGPGLWCTAGIHPHDAKQAQPGWQGRLTELAGHHRITAIGETGLDFNRNFSPPAVQRAVFVEQLAVAVELGKPVFVHERDTDGEVASLLAEFAPKLPGAVVHCFTGSAADLRAYLEAGFYIGITGWVTERKRGAALRELVRKIPLERLLVETDAPFLRPQNAPTTKHRRNEPALLTYVVAQLAELYSCSTSELAEVTSRNATELFRLNDK
tara:strand:+ start:1928 stop:2716 length:789 start_codon:yes stop_codon:yes gene_type:complete